MEPFMHIPFGLNGPFYAAFYAAAFLLGATMVFIEGRRRQWPVASCIALICACVLGAIAGSKLLMIPPTAWFELSGGGLPVSSGKTLIGGLLGGAIAVAVTRRLLRFPSSAADAFVWPVLLLVPLGRLGCLLGGCCFGRPAEVLWSVTYASGSAPFLTQVAEGHIPHDAVASLPVHPVPGYEIVFFLVLALVIWRTRRLTLSPGNRFYGVALLYGAFRFFEEFLRHTSLLANGLTSVQLGLVPAIVVLTVFVVVREMRSRRGRYPMEAVPTHSGTAAAGMITGLWLALWLSTGWFTPLELVVASLILAAGTLLLALHALTSVLVPRLHVMSITAALILPMGLILDGTTVLLPDTLRTHFLEIGLGGTSTDYLGNVLVGYDQGCDEDIPRYASSEHQYHIGGLEARYAVQNGPYNRSTVGARLYGGRDLRHALGPVREARTQILGINPYFKLDRQWFGVGAGLHVGQLLIKPERDDDNLRHLMPMLTSRIGQEEFFLDASVGDGMPGGSPGMWWQAGAGATIALGPREHLRVRVGSSQVGLYVNPSLRIRDRFTLYGQFAPVDENHHHVSGGLLYRIPLK
jgi:prolipoprotein diacylglyceryltransferase